MATFATYPTNGTNDTFTLPFPYIDRAHVVVKLNGVVQDTSTYTFPTVSTVKLNTMPAAGGTVEVRRSTPAFPITEYQGGGVLTKGDLETDSKQALFLIEEFADDKQNESQVRALIEQAGANGLGAGLLREDLLSALDAMGAALIRHTAGLSGASTSRTVRDKLREVVSVRDFGAMGDGIADDTVAVQAALNSGAEHVFAPSGIYRIQPITVPSAVKSFFGAGEATKFVAIGTPAPFTPYMQFSSLNGFDVYGFSVQVNKTTYPQNHAMYFGTCLNGRVRDVRIIDGGYMAIYAPACQRVTFRDIQVDSHQVHAFRADTTPQSITVDNLRATSAGSSHTIQIIGGARHKVVNCSSNKHGPADFGISMLQVDDSIVANNDLQTDTTEGINVQDSTRVSVVNNTVTCLAGHHDFGISLYASTGDVSHCIVSGNRVYNSGKSGIGCEALNPRYCNQNHIVGNLVVNPNALNEAQGAGILLYGWAGNTQNTIQANRLIDQGSKMRYGVHEFNSGGGLPSNNRVVDNAAFGAGLLGENKVASDSLAFDVSKTAFAPVVTAQTGAITAASASANYQRRGKFLNINISVTITTNGTGAGAVVITVPPEITLVNGTLNGRENAVSGKQLVGVVTGGGTQIAIRHYDNTYPGADGASLHLSGIMELA